MTGYLHQIFALPYAAYWIPSLMFLIVVGGVYFFSRMSLRVASAALEHGRLGNQTAEAMPVLIKPSAQEQRQSKRRVGNPIEVFLAEPDNKHDPRRVCLVDRSLGGMRFVSPREMDAGVIISVRPVHAEEIVPWIDLEIRSCRPCSEQPGQFELCCQFVKSPPYSILMLYG